MKCICNNETCRLFGQEQTLTKATYKFIDGKIRLSTSCEGCGRALEEIPSEEPPTIGSVYIGKYSSGSKEQRQEMLKKRARDHFKKEIKPFKDHQHNELVKEFKEISKGK